MSFLQIASWNIEHLGGSKRASRKQSAFALADHIEMAGVHLIVLQEIYVTPNDEEVRLGDGQPPIPRATPEGERRSADLDLVCWLLEEHLERAWTYRILPNRAPGDTSQLCALLWDTGRLTLDSIQPLAVPKDVGGDAIWDRKPHVVSFTTDLKVWRRPAGGDWVETAELRRISVVPLHMKSNYGGVTKNRAVRAKEAVALCDALEALIPRPDPSLILIGDTNILDNAEPAIETFIARGFVDLNNNDSATYWSAQYAEAPFDRAFVAKDRPEFRYTRQYVLRSSDLTAHDRYLSDHYMIKVSVKDYVDDEDPR